MKILCGGPVSEDAPIFAAHIESLKSQGLPLGYKGIDNSPVPLPRPDGFLSVDWRTEPTLGEYKGLRVRWSRLRRLLLSRLREEMRLAAIDGGYDYLWMVDSDLLPGPETLRQLLDAGKDFIAGMVRMGGWINVLKFGGWRGRLTKKEKNDLRSGGISRVDWTGACSLISRVALRKISYAPRDGTWGEDDCLAESAREAGLQLFVHADTAIEVRRRRG